MVSRLQQSQRESEKNSLKAIDKSRYEVYIKVNNNIDWKIGRENNRKVERPIPQCRRNAASVTEIFEEG